MRLPLDPFEAFDFLDKKCSTTIDAIHEVRKQAGRDFAEAVAIEARSKGCKSRDYARQLEAIGEETRQLFEMLYRHEAEQEIETLQAKLKKLGERLAQARKALPLRGGEVVVVWQKINQWGSNQFGSNYTEAEGALFLFAAQLRYPDLKWELQTIRRTHTYDKADKSPHAFRDYRPWCEVHVTVRLEDERMRHALGSVREVVGAVDLKEQARFYLKRGCNLRCVNPFLPYGIEKKLGMDYWGNDLGEKKT